MCLTCSTEPAPVSSPSSSGCGAAQVMSSALLVLANLVAPSPALLPVLPSPAAGGRNLNGPAAAGLRSPCAPAPGSSHPAAALTALSEDGFAAARASVRSSNGLKVRCDPSVLIFTKG